MRGCACTANRPCPAGAVTQPLAPCPCTPHGTAPAGAIPQTGPATARRNRFAAALAVSRQTGLTCPRHDQCNHYHPCHCCSHHVPFILLLLVSFPIPETGPAIPDTDSSLYLPMTSFRCSPLSTSSVTSTVPALYTPLAPDSSQSWPHKDGQSKINGFLGDRSSSVLVNIHQNPDSLYSAFVVKTLLHGITDILATSEAHNEYELINRWQPESLANSRCPPTLCRWKPTLSLKDRTAISQLSSPPAQGRWDAARLCLYFALECFRLRSRSADGKPGGRNR